MMQIYKGIGTDHCDHEDLIDFLNYVFGMNGFDSGFYRLLPKLTARPSVRRITTSSSSPKTASFVPPSAPIPLR